MGAELTLAVATDGAAGKQEDSVTLHPKRRAEAEAGHADHRAPSAAVREAVSFAAPVLWMDTLGGTGFVSTAAKIVAKTQRTAWIRKLANPSYPSCSPR
jgi:LmbE family N-acetylglucosaminyl deacetylase